MDICIVIRFVEWHDDFSFVPKILKMPFLEGLKKAPDLHLNQIIDLKAYDMYFVFTTRIASIYVFYKTVQYELRNHNKFVTPKCPKGSAHL